ncbi:MAG: transferrin-binding protein-like solute binding protein [Novosphingobium sp.]|nr:transferrin-binding protein-like solute binding protein [Novosphingobium sp.]
MRSILLLASTSLLAACGGGGLQTVSAPPPAAGGGSGAADPHTFANPTDAKTYVGVGGSQVYEYLTDARGCCNQQAQIYAGKTTTVRNSTISITYDPADAVYTLEVQDPLSGAAARTRFQDPASRTDFGGNLEPQWGTPELSNGNIEYYQAGDGNPLSPYRESGSGFINPGDNDNPPTGETGSSYQAASLFVLRPGAETQYVTFAGYVRNALTFSESTAGTDTFETTNWHLERGAFAYGETTLSDAVPTTGTGSYQGSMLASMIFNPTLDGQSSAGSAVLPSFFQWIEGSSTLDVNFADDSFELALIGTVLAPQLDYYTSSPDTVLSAGATFNASAEGLINLINFGGFKGQFDSAYFTNPGGDRHDVAIAGSTIDGAFYGPNGEEAGGGFRIVGGTPDERIDILGAFVGVK